MIGLYNKTLYTMKIKRLDEGYIIRSRIYYFINYYTLEVIKNDFNIEEFNGSQVKKIIHNIIIEMDKKFVL